jgi:hypothetical protein
MALPVSTQDKLAADRFSRAIHTRNKKAIAEEIAFLREDAIRCALVRFEREFNVKRRKT